MLKKTLTYTDYNEVERTEDFHFNLTEMELTEMECSANGGLSVMIQNIIDAKDVPALIDTFKKLVLQAYGVKTPDGRLIKNDKVREEFTSKQAYSDIFMELAFNADSATAFVKGILPSKYQQ